MTLTEMAALFVRIAASLVWLAYLARLARLELDGLRLHYLVVTAIVAIYAVAQAYRALTAPTLLVPEFTAIATVSLVAGLALLVSPRR